jgi:transposase
MPAAAASPIKVTLPSDVKSLHAMVREREAMVLERDLLIDKLKLQIARMKRARFGASSEKLDTQIMQLELIVEDLESTLSAHQTNVPAAASATAADATAQTNACDGVATTSSTPERRVLPEHLPRERVVYAPMGGSAHVACGCKHCGADEKHLTALGTDESEILEYVPGRFKVLVQVRPKYLCGGCKTISQADAPLRPLPRSYAGAGLLAHVLTSKYADHLPLYRQSEIYAREGVELSRSTLADWVGGASHLLNPLVGALAGYVTSGGKLHADDTPVPVLQPGRGTTKTGRLGRMCAMIAMRPTRRHKKTARTRINHQAPSPQLSGLLIRLIVRVNIQSVISKTSRASCKPMVTRASSAFISAVMNMAARRLWRLRVGRTCGESSLICTRCKPRLWRWRR